MDRTRDPANDYTYTRKVDYHAAEMIDFLRYERYEDPPDLPLIETSEAVQAHAERLAKLLGQIFNVEHRGGWAFDTLARTMHGYIYFCERGNQQEDGVDEVVPQRYYLVEGERPDHDWDRYLPELPEIPPRHTGDMPHEIRAGYHAVALATVICCKARRDLRRFSAMCERLGIHRATDFELPDLVHILKTDRADRKQGREEPSSGVSTKPRDGAAL